MITSAERTVEIDAPVADAYAVVSDVTLYPRFLRGISAVRRLEDGGLEFVSGTRAWRAGITEENPGVGISWTSHGDVRHSGILTLEPLAADRTLVALRIDHDGSTGDDPTTDLAELAGLVRTGSPPPRRVLSLAAILGVHVSDPHGEPVGEVLDAHVDLDRHMVTSIIVGAAGRAEGHLVALPPTPMDAAARGIVLPYPRDMVREAPTAERGFDPPEASLHEAQRHFADPVGWARDREAVRARQAVPAPTPELRAMSEGESASAGTPAPTPQIAEIAVEHDDHEPEGGR
jgi:sporulation protein YlmC with PRC-barrel domain